MSEWKMVRIGDFCSIAKGNIGITKAIPGEFTLVTTADKRLSHNEYAFSKPAVIIPLVSGTGHGHASINRIHYQDGKFSVGSILGVVTPKDSSILNANFLYHFLDVFKEELLVRRMRGMANVTLPIKAIAEIEFPLLSIEQQQHWVNLLNRTSQNTANITNELTHQKALLKKLRQSILQDAVSGKLTEQWRAENPVTESAAELLKRIQSEKAELVKAGKIKKQKPLPPVKAEEIPFDLPESWVWCRLGEIVHISSGDGLISSNMEKDGQIPVFGGNGINGYHNSYNVTKPTIVIGRVGALCGSIHLTPSKAWITDNAFITSFDQQNINIEWLIKILIAVDLRSKARETAQPVISGQRVYPILIPLPPLAEQQAIVAKVEALLKHCDQLETEISASEQNSQMLLQTVLKEAFNPA